MEYRNMLHVCAHHVFCIITSRIKANYIPKKSQKSVSFKNLSLESFCFIKMFFGCRKLLSCKLQHCQTMSISQSNESICGQWRQQITTSNCSTHNLNDTIKFNVSSKGLLVWPGQKPFLAKVLCSKTSNLIVLFRLYKQTWLFMILPSLATY